MACFLGGMDGHNSRWLYHQTPREWGHLPLPELCPFKMQGQIHALFLCSIHCSQAQLGRNRRKYVYRPL